MNDERLDKEKKQDDTFANEETPLGVTKADQAGPGAQREAAINGSWAPGPGSGPEGTGVDLGASPSAPAASHPKGEGPDAPNQPAAGHGKGNQRHQHTVQAAGKMTRKPRGAAEETPRGPKTYGTASSYKADERTTPAEQTHEGDLSLAGGSSGSGGGGEEILRGPAYEARPAPPSPVSATAPAGPPAPGQPAPGGEQPSEERSAETPNT